MSASAGSVDVLNISQESSRVVGGGGAAGGSSILGGGGAAAGTAMEEIVYNSKFPMNYTPSYLTLYEFEKFENHEEWRQWMYTHWHWSVYASAAYLLIVFYGQWWMRDRQPLKLRKVLTAWNMSLAIFSSIGFLRSAPELLVSVLKPDGFHRSVCYL